MIRMRRAAPGLLVYGVLLVVLTTGTAALAQATQAARTDPGIAALVVDRLAYLAIANLTVWAGVLIMLWRWAGARVQRTAEAVVEAHDGLADAHEVASQHNHEPLHRAMGDLDKGMGAVLAELRRLADAVAPIAGFEERLRLIELRHAAIDGASRDPNASPRMRREGDPEGFVPKRGQS